ncbi:Inositol 2-dehydrogenase [Posidoniimonas polymericola]|uniref:Inositol 2-dehydrogenase n=1 Tax=Posidoniimonas polymericola TaxID=2528002 RepID=A0A5C5YHW2_9BACT|nr:Gfo/Idh/MocA family oxidoreductase [Posidoniimonas polymericola]TWT73462.1 Inositol 2-dehydrogenase [Posidoniimonas polymericola]
MAKQNQESELNTPATRRGFLAASGAVIATASVASRAMAVAPHTFGNDTIKVGLVGCGGRGKSAIGQIINTPGPVKVVALADAFEYRIQEAIGSASAAARERIGDGPGNVADIVDVPAERQFVGLDAYKGLLETDCDLVVLATPPGFRPVQFEAAVNAGKHVFTEKPLATDAHGVRRVLAAGEIAKKNNTAVAVGLQRRHEPKYIETIGRLRDGAIGDIILTRVYWNSGPLWNRSRYDLAQRLGRRPNELEYQVENWYYFNWLCGDHIVEQHIHNIDVSNWLFDAVPEYAYGMGGREVRTGKQYGQIFDHHMVEFTMPGGAKMLSACRHQSGCVNNVSEHAHGTEGTADISGGTIYAPDGKVAWRYEGRNPQGHQQEQTDLIANLRKGVIQNETEYGAHSTMSAILGRMVTYSGKQIRWDDAIASELRLSGDIHAWDAPAPVTPDEDGRYPVPVPGKTEVV